MEMLLAAALFAVGVLLVVKGSDVFVDAAGWVSDVTGISKAVIGATIVSVATTSPEYFVSLMATLKGYNDLSIGNAVGSLICNIGVAFALLAMFTPGAVRDKLYGIKGFAMIIATMFLFIFCLNGVLSVPEGLALLAIFIVFTFVNIRYSKDGEGKGKRKRTNKKEIIINVAKFVFGAAGVVFGSNLIVDNAQVIAIRLGIPQAIIGLTIVAIGTSLPEIATSIAAIVKKQNALSIGNILGANVLDATLILATGAFVSGGKLSVSPNTVGVDLPATLIVMAIAVIPTAIGKRIYRWQGMLIIGTYAAYLLFITLG